MFIGRCADYVLRDRDDVLNVFIYAPDKIRLQHLLEEYREKEESREKLNTADDFIPFEDDIRELMHATDQKRSDYYKYVTGSLRSERYHKDLIINTGTLGVNGAVQAIKAAVMAKFGDD